MSYNLTIADEHLEMFCRALALLSDVHIGKFDLLAAIPNMHFLEERAELLFRAQALSPFITNKGSGQPLDLSDDTVSEEGRLAHDWLQVLQAARAGEIYQGQLLTNNVSPTQIERQEPPVNIVVD